MKPKFTFQDQKLCVIMYVSETLTGMSYWLLYHVIVISYGEKFQSLVESFVLWCFKISTYDVTRD